MSSALWSERLMDNPSVSKGGNNEDDKTTTKDDGNDNQQNDPAPQSVQGVSNKNDTLVHTNSDGS